MNDVDDDDVDNNDDDSRCLFVVFVDCATAYTACVRLKCIAISIEA